MQSTRKKIQGFVASYHEEMGNKFLKLLKDAYRIYTSSAASTLALKILGSSALRSDLPLLSNFGSLHQSTDKFELSARFHEDSILQNAGGVIHFSGWNLMSNDAAILGAIHARQPVYVEYDFEQLKSMNGEDVYREDNIRVLFRELLQLKAAGYVVIDEAAFSGAVLVSVDHEKAFRFTMRDLLESVHNIDCGEKVEEQMRSFSHIHYDDYHATC